VRRRARHHHVFARKAGFDQALAIASAAGVVCARAVAGVGADELRVDRAGELARGFGETVSGSTGAPAATAGEDEAGIRNMLRILTPIV